jgi:hypothetical protein
MSAAIKLSAGGTIAVKVYQASGGNEDIGFLSSNLCQLTITKVS